MSLFVEENHDASTNPPMAHGIPVKPRAAPSLLLLLLLLLFNMHIFYPTAAVS